MLRAEFIQHVLGGLFTMNTLKDLKKFSDSLSEQENNMPVFFVGHGSPMNGIEDNEFSQRWQSIGKDTRAPKAVLVISAHWYTKGTFITAMDMPKTIHDFYGFPKPLFDVQYPAPGSPSLAKETVSLVKKTKIGLDHEWGLDHGTWSVVKHMYPEANIPVLQLSIDYTQPPQYHYELATELAALRKKGVLIIGSGNMVHNLGILDWKMQHDGYDWANDMNEKFKTLISAGDHKALINYENLGSAAKLSIPTPEHYLPMLYTLGLATANEPIQFFNDKTLMGSISMTSFKAG
jgi:4,5-DOPA dioxygenase extradiol